MPGRLDKLSTGSKPACATVRHGRGPMPEPDEQHSVELLDERRPLQPNRLPMLTPVLFHPVSEAEQHLGIIEEFCLDIGNVVSPSEIALDSRLRQRRCGAEPRDAPDQFDSCFLDRIEHLPILISKAAPCGELSRLGWCRTAYSPGGSP